MCIVTYVPKKNGFILTSNRDEEISRASQVTFPEIISFDEETLIFPKDKQGGGSWIASDNSGKSAVLLNGSKQPHSKNITYRKSRGLVLLDSFGYDTASDFHKNYLFTNIEPFTLILIHYNNGKTLLNKIIWDGQTAQLSKINERAPQIWSAVSLYDWANRTRHEELFNDFLKRGDFTVFGVRKLHEGKLQRELSNGLSTVSVTSIEFDDRGGEIVYNDLLSKNTKREFL